MLNIWPHNLHVHWLHIKIQHSNIDIETDGCGLQPKPSFQKSYIDPNSSEFRSLNQLNLNLAEGF
jgi:hypothetical protein